MLKGVKNVETLNYGTRVIRYERKNINLNSCSALTSEIWYLVGIMYLYNWNLLEGIHCFVFRRPGTLEKPALANYRDKFC